MTSHAQKQLGILQRSLYEKAYEEAHSFIQAGSEQVKKYAEEFEQSLPNDFIRAGLKDVLEPLRSNGIVLFADFHTLKQSQRALVRLVKSYVERFSRTNLVLALECFRASDQKALDDYLAGRCKETELLARTNYARNWGLPWSHYRMVLECAKEFGMPVVGINTRNGGQDYLSFRDQFAARKLVATAKRYPKSTIVCMIGESHLAEEHLPRHISQELQGTALPHGIVRILTNVDKYFFKLQAMSPHLTTEYLKIRENLFCIINTPPWMKWQSYAVWEEMRSVLEIADEDDNSDNDYTEDTFDLDYQLFSLVKNLSQFLNSPLPESALSGFHIHMTPDDDFEDSIEGEGITDEKQLGAILERISLDGVFFLPKTRTVLLSDMSMNNIAEASSQLLHALTVNFHFRGEDFIDEFWRRCIAYAIGMAGSKILNPRRKCPDLVSYRAFVDQNSRKHLTGYARTKRDVARAVLAHDHLLTEHLDKGTPLTARNLRAIIQLDVQSAFSLSRAIGSMMGLKLYKKAISGQAASSTLKAFFECPLNSKRDVEVLFKSTYAATILK